MMGVVGSVVSRSWLTVLLLLSSVTVPGALCSQYGDAEHVTAILGNYFVLNCPVSLPDTPYVIQWTREDYNDASDIWWVAPNGRASLVNHDTSLSLASLNFTSVKEEDRGWYKCRVLHPAWREAENGTWIHLSVHAAPRFTTTPNNVTYVNIGDSIILNCEAEGIPKPEIFWFRDDEPVAPSDSVAILSDGTELRITKIRDQDIGEYLCVATNAQGRVHYEAQVVLAGPKPGPPHRLSHDPTGPKPGPPRNVTVVHGFAGYTISWTSPLGSVPIATYDIDFKVDGPWKRLNTERIVNETSYTVTELTPGQKYTFRVFARTLTSHQVSEEVTFTVEEQVPVTGLVVAGILLCLVAVVLYVCTVKICNKRKRKRKRKNQEKSELENEIDM